MAERMADDAIVFVGRASPQRIYPWAEWLDGSTWHLTRGADFDVSMTSMRTMCYSEAKRRSGTVRVKVDGEDLYLRFTPS